MKRVLLIGNGAREHAIAEAVLRSDHSPVLFSYMKANNPGINTISNAVKIGEYHDIKAIRNFAKKCKVKLAIIGPEGPLDSGVVDALLDMGILCVGPTKLLANLETSKSFTRHILNKYKIPGNIRYKVFFNVNGIENFMDEVGEVVIKPDGLTGGKGVKVQGEHFFTKKEAFAICKSILEEHAFVVIEKKLEGEEFSLQFFCDGKTVLPTIPVRDHKRRFVGDLGPNTGGMGSYSCSNHLLPFLRQADIDQAISITQQVADALVQEFDELYKGIMYGGFIATADGVKLLEYNARLGDPEAMNILTIMKTDFLDVCDAVVRGYLDEVKIAFAKKATVCKYIVPQSYGLSIDSYDEASASVGIQRNRFGSANLFYSSVDQKEDGLHMTSSRALAIVGISRSLATAEQIAETAVKQITGPIDYRSDIGKPDLIVKSIEHMKKLRG